MRTLGYKGSFPSEREDLIKIYVSLRCKYVNQNPEVKKENRLHLQEYRQRPEAIKKRKEWRARPEVKKKNREYQREYRQKKKDLTGVIQ